MESAYALVITSALALTLATLCPAAEGAKGREAGRNHEVRIDEAGRLHPATIEIEVGDTITWSNPEDDGFDRRVTSDAVVLKHLAFDTGWIPPDRQPSQPVRFTKEGFFPYTCRGRRPLEASWKGMVIVKPKSK